MIIMDNGSTDNTAAFALSEWQKYKMPAPLYVITEPRPGTAIARESGIQKSKYEFVLFCDDDNWLIDSYVENVYNIMTSNAEIAALGGQGEAVCEVQPPAWFEQFKAYYAIGPQAGRDNPSKVSLERGFLYTAGSTFRKSVIEDLENTGFKSVLEGRTGKNLAGGEDVELCYNIILNGGHIYYDSRLLFKHYMTKPRLNWPYYKRMIRAFGKGYSLLMPYKLLLNKQEKRFKMGIKWLYLSAFYLIFRTLFIDMPKSLFDNQFLAARANLESHIGFLESLLTNHNAVVNLYKKLESAPWIVEEYRVTR
ncbi:hypothetical protein PK28_05830 [Hymenobacter sp. DG25B]|nr:hypothetical protein PK28_05830 [Hymenobacter sp. DG25B]